MRHLIGVAGLLLFSTTWAAENYPPKSIGDLTEICRYAVEPDKTPKGDALVMFQSGLDVGYCWGYMKGLGDLHALQTASKKSAPCFPPGVNQRQIVRMYIKWADENPELIHFDPVFGFYGAFATTFSCSAK